MIRQRKDMKSQVMENCHDGSGNLTAFSVLQDGDSEAGISFIHDDVLEPSAIIGEHPHENAEEVYFVVEGQGRMILDGKEYPIGPGDVCLCKSGHSHGIINSSKGPLRLLVFGVKK